MSTKLQSFSKNNGMLSWVKNVSQFCSFVIVFVTTSLSLNLLPPSQEKGGKRKKGFPKKVKKRKERELEGSFLGSDCVTCFNLSSPALPSPSFHSKNLEPIRDDEAENQSGDEKITQSTPKGMKLSRKKKESCGKGGKKEWQCWWRRGWVVMVRWYRQTIAIPLVLI